MNSVGGQECVKGAECVDGSHLASHFIQIGLLELSFIPKV